MKRDEYTSDIVVFGGSLAGLAAAITAKEQNPDLDVILVEQYFTGYAGKANRGGGIFIWFDPEEDQGPEWMINFQLNHMGRYLHNQDLLKEFWSTLNDNLDQTDRWTFRKKFARTPEGKYVARSRNSQGFRWSLVNLDLDYLIEMNKFAKQLGIKVIDHVSLVDVLTDNGRAAGAVGINVETGTPTVFNAKAVILATGAQNFRNMPMWSSGRGEGISAAWRAGATLTSCELANFFQWSTLEYFEPITLSDNDMYAADGTRIAEGIRTKYDPDVDSRTLCAWWKHNMNGNGPIRYLAPDAHVRKSMATLQRVRPFSDRFRGTTVFNDQCNKAGPEVVPILIGEMGPLKIDNGFMTTIPGLFAAGDICYGGSHVSGLIPAPPGRTRGSGLPFASFSGRKAGTSASKYVVDKELGKIDEHQVAASEYRFNKPLTREGGCSPRDISSDVQRIMNSIGYSLYFKEERIDEALKIVEGIKERLRVMSARDLHGAIAANEADAAVLCVELFLRAARERKESRAWFQREDYPNESDEWLKWINITNRDGKMDIEFEDIPFDKYEFQPRPEDL